VAWRKPGISTFFIPPPAWQSKINLPPSVNPGAKPGGGVPDIAADADPVTGYQVRVDGQNTVIGGTSAVAPLWAALVALLNQSLGKSVGYFNPWQSKLKARTQPARAAMECLGRARGLHHVPAPWRFKAARPVFHVEHPLVGC
jgi:hypothetical protein